MLSECLIQLVRIFCHVLLVEISQFCIFPPQLLFQILDLLLQLLLLFLLVLSDLLHQLEIARQKMVDRISSFRDWPSSTITVKLSEGWIVSGSFLRKLHNFLHLNSTLLPQNFMHLLDV